VINMIVIRDVFQAKYGKGGELVQLFKEVRQAWGADLPYGTRILTDVSGPFFTVVVETHVESLAAWQQVAERFTGPDFEQWFGRMQGLVDSGRREFYNIET
jgi:hypothetical protein